MCALQGFSVVFEASLVALWLTLARPLVLAMH